jgi:hypothetical protein
LKPIRLGHFTSERHFNLIRDTNINRSAQTGDRISTVILTRCQR